MKIKRMKSGARGHAEGKLEIVQQSEATDDAAATPNGSPDPIGLSAAEIVAAVKQNVKAGVNIAIGPSNAGGKVRLTSSNATGSATASTASTGGVAPVASAAARPENAA